MGSHVLRVNYLSRLLEKFNAQRNSHLFCDVNLIVDGKMFKLHRSVLAANSDYFWKLFSSIKDQNTFVLPGVPLVGFQALLDYMYTAKWSLNKLNVDDVYTASIILGFEHMKSACEKVYQELKLCKSQEMKRIPSSQDQATSEGYVESDDNIQFPFIKSRNSKESRTETTITKSSSNFAENSDICYESTDNENLEREGCKRISTDQRSATDEDVDDDEPREKRTKRSEAVRNKDHRNVSATAVVSAAEDRPPCGQVLDLSLQSRCKPEEEIPVTKQRSELIQSSTTFNAASTAAAMRRADFLYPKCKTHGSPIVIICSQQQPSSDPVDQPASDNNNSSGAVQFDFNEEKTSTTVVVGSPDNTQMRDNIDNCFATMSAESRHKNRRKLHKTKKVMTAL